MIQRTFDPAFLNSVVNHPEVRPWLAGDGPLNVSEQLANPANYALVSEYGGFILMRHEPGIYEVHSQFLPRHSGAAIRAMREAMLYMFARTECETIVSFLPDGNKAAHGLAIAGGLREVFRSAHVCSGNGAYLSLEIMDWAMRTKALETEGAWFHEQLEAAKALRGSALPHHDDDPAHDRAVGAAVMMMRAGNAAKGVRFYNRWARMAGYEPIALVSAQPIVVDVVDAVVGLNGENLEMLLCR